MSTRNIELMHSLFGKIEGHTCKECSNLASYTANRKWYKCQVYGFSSCESTDWRLKYTACGYFNKAFYGLPVKEYSKHLPKNKREEVKCEGQISIFDTMESEK